jgi:uncharacterized integral membrane protein
MVALIAGILMIVFTVFAALPAKYAGLGWGSDMLLILRGGGPIIAGFIGLIAVFIGIADLKDKQEAKKEEAAARANSVKPE